MNIPQIIASMIIPAFFALWTFHCGCAAPVSGQSDPVVQFTMRHGIHEAIDWTRTDNDMANVASTSEDHIENTEICPTTVKNGYNLPANEKSTCPWYYEVNHSKSRYPATILRAVSKCTKCIGSHDLECHPVIRKITTLTQNGTDAQGDVIYEENEISVAVGFTCGGRNTVDNAATQSTKTTPPFFVN